MKTIQPFDSFLNQGAIVISSHARNSGVSWLSIFRAGKRSSEPFKADTGDSIGRARDARQEHGAMYCSLELKRLSLVIRGISRAFSRVDFQAGERQCVKRPARFTADGRADRFFSHFDRIYSFFRACRQEKGSVSSMRTKTACRLQTGVKVIKSKGTVSRCA